MKTEMKAETQTQHAPLAYKLKDAAKMLGVSEKSVRRAIGRRLINPIKAFRHILISAEELQRFITNTTGIDGLAS